MKSAAGTQKYVDEMRRQGSIPYEEAQAQLDPAKPFNDLPSDGIDDPESEQEAEAASDKKKWTFWDEEISASLEHESEWRMEAIEAQHQYQMTDPNKGSSSARHSSKKETDRVATVHANTDTIKPMVYSQPPEMVVTRRNRGDGEEDPTDRVGAEICMRIGAYLVDATNLHTTAELCRDDWLVPGRSAFRVRLREDVESDQITGEERVVDQRIDFQYMRHSRVLYGVADTWDEVPWIAYEVPMTVADFRERFGDEITDETDFPIRGLVAKNDASRTEEDNPDNHWAPDNRKMSRGDRSVKSARDRTIVWEIWSKKTRKITWFCKDYTKAVLDEMGDPLGLEGFWDSPKPLVASTIGGTVVPRPDIKFYESHARKIDLASAKLDRILKTISVSGVYAGEARDKIQKLLNGENTMVAIEEWLGFVKDKGGINGMIDWLPIEQFMQAAQALVLMRDQEKQLLFEVSGVSDIVRGQGDPSETATAQEIKGRFANMRLTAKQRRMGEFVLEGIVKGIELVVKHFSIDRIAEMVNLDLPRTDAERQEMIRQSYIKRMSAAVLSGEDPNSVPPDPTIPEVSLESVIAKLQQDMLRRYSIRFETDSTVDVDQQADKEARIEFLSAFAQFLEAAISTAQSGLFPMSVAKEILMFAVRGFPKARTLEGLINSLPDDQEMEPQEDTSVTVAKIRAETDLMIAKLKGAQDLQETQMDHLHQRQMKGADILARGSERET